MKNRVKTAVIIVAVTCLCVFLSRATRIAFFTLCAMAAVWETCSVLKHGEVRGNFVIPMAYCAVQGVLCAFSVSTVYMLGLYFLFLFLALFWGIIRADGKNALGTVFSMCYPASFFAVIIWIASHDMWMSVLVTAVGSAWACDSCALIFGKKLGKHKLAPKVSPNKTVEGTICGALASLIAGVLLFFIFRKMEVSLFTWMIIALICSSLGQTGDLAASLIKRMCGVKDYSSLMGEHGGIMDKYDSMLFAIPACMMLFYMFGIL